MRDNALSFRCSDLRTLLEDSCNAEKHRALYGEEHTAKPGLWLVGDEGVYFMSNAEYDEGDERPGVVYAKECNPRIMEFDAWWDTKGKTFGGSDGVEFLEVEMLEQILKTGSLNMFIVFEGKTMRFTAGETLV